MDEVGLANVLDVGERPRLEVVDADHPIATSKELVAQVGAEKARPPGDQARRHWAGNLPNHARRPPTSGMAPATHSPSSRFQIGAFALISSIR
jgi:hypothetical protein